MIFDKKFALSLVFSLIQRIALSFHLETVTFETANQALVYTVIHWSYFVVMFLFNAVCFDDLIFIVRKNNDTSLAFQFMFLSLKLSYLFALTLVAVFQIGLINIFILFTYYSVMNIAQVIALHLIRRR